MRPLCFSILLVFTAFTHAGANWPDFRGPDMNGHAIDGDYPLEWSENQNVKWKTAIHDLGWSSPVVWDDQIWLTTATEDGAKMWAICVDFESGAIVQNILLFENENPQRKHGLNSYATPSPVIEENRVYVHYGTFGTACLDTKTGRVLWKRTDLNCEHMQGAAASPLLYKHLLIVHVEGTDVQYVIALDKSNGKQIWKTARPPELYKDVKPVYRKDYGTPIVIQADGKDQLISPGAQVCMAFDPLTGGEIWRVIYRHDSTISRPVTGDGLVFLNTGWAADGREIWGVRLGGQGDITASHVVWKDDDKAPGESSPVFVDGRLYWIEDNGFLKCVEAKSGKLLWNEKLSGKFGASPVYANGRIYFCNKKGETTVIKPGPVFEKIAGNELDDQIWASPAFVGTSIIIRTKSFLYRISK